MTEALLVGLGAVGTRAARQLIDSPELERLHLADRDPSRADRVARSLGARATVSSWRPGDGLPGAVSVVVSAVPDPYDEAVTESALGQGRTVVSAIDAHSSIEARVSRHDDLAASGGILLAGAGLAPGLADVLVAHGASRFDEVDEIRVARSGWAGPASITTLRHELRGPVVDRHDGQWRTLARGSEEIVWFPEPICARDCEPVQLGLRLLVEAFPHTPSISVVTSEPVGRVRFRRHRRRGDETEWGATRVEVWGRRGEAREVVVYGVIDRTAVAAGTMLAVAALAVAGHVDAELPSSGVFGLGAARRPAALLEELAERGVRAAVFEGAPVAD